MVVENAQRHFQDSLFGCFEYVPYTVLTIVCTINVSIRINYLILLQGKIYLIENQDNEKNKIVCKDDDFLAFKANENLKFCTMMYRMAT